MQAFWNERYRQAEYAYGKMPNAYFKSVIDTFQPGNILIPGAGEGRDAVYAARCGWHVDAFDYSVSGQQKALQLAAEAGVAINFQVIDAADFDPTLKQYDLISLTFFHLPQALRKTLHAKLVQALNPDGYLSLEIFSPAQLQFDSGGPKDVTMLMTEAEVREEFAGLDILKLEALETDLDEGPYHQGKAAVIRFLGRKNIV